MRKAWVRRRRKPARIMGFAPPVLSGHASWTYGKGGTLRPWPPRSALSRPDHVARAADRVQERRVEAFVDFGAQPADMHVDHICLGIEMIFPHAFQEHGAGHDLAGVAH